MAGSCLSPAMLSLDPVLLVAPGSLPDALGEELARWCGLAAIHFRVNEVLSPTSVGERTLFSTGLPPEPGPFFPYCGDQRGNSGLAPF